MQRINESGQPVGAALPHWQSVPLPAAKVRSGRYWRLEPLDCGQHADDLYAAFACAPDNSNRTYLKENRPASLAALHLWLSQLAAVKGFVTFTVVCAQRHSPVGLLSYLRIDQANGAPEIGGVVWSPLIKRTVIGTEALWVMIANTFAPGYRRCEWK